MTHKSGRRASDGAVDPTEFFGPGARLKPRARIPANIEESPGYKPNSNHNTVNLAEAVALYRDAVVDASRPRRKALIARLQGKAATL